MPSGIPPKDNRVPWETPVEGQPPAFKQLSKKEAEKLALAAIEEARQFTEGPAANLASESQKFISSAENRRNHHKLNVELYESLGKLDEENKHREWLSEALLDLGQFDEARAALIGKGGEPVNRELYDYIGAVSFACYRPDSDKCNCPREKVEENQGNNTVTLELDRRFAVRPILSPYHRDGNGNAKVVEIWRCRHCGHLNARADAPARQSGNETLRRQVESETRRAIAAKEIPLVTVSDVKTLKAS